MTAPTQPRVLIVGGGFAGLSAARALAGAPVRVTLVDRRNHHVFQPLLYPGEFRRIQPRSARVILVEGADRVLPPYPPDLSGKALRQLERLGVDRAGRLKVEPDLTVPGHPEVYVAGDLAAVAHDGKPVPGVAPAATQMGRHAAGNIIRVLEGQPRRRFSYRDRGSLATIGRKAAVADVGGLRLSGLPAWLAWLGIHIFFLIGFRNRAVVMFEWALAYLTYARSARIVLGRACREEPDE